MLDSDPADDMCPNCVTPWKCNGPHLVRETPYMRRLLESRQPWYAGCLWLVAAIAVLIGGRLDD